MKVGEITESYEDFSFKNQRFSNKKYILATRDIRYEYNVIPVLAFDNGKILDLDEYEFGNNIFATRPPVNNPNIEDLPLSRFFYNQLIKIDYGTIIENAGAENPNLPKVKTFNANIHGFEANQVIEFFEGEIEEKNSLFKPVSNDYLELIKNLYLESGNSFFVVFKQKLIGPFVALKVNGDSLEVTKSSWRPFGEYNFSETNFLEFETNEILRRIYIPESADLALEFKDSYDFLSDDELLKKFELELAQYPDYFKSTSLENIKNILSRSSELKSLDETINNNNRLKDLLKRSEEVLSNNVDLIDFFPEVRKIKEDHKNLQSSFFDTQKELEKKREDLGKEIKELSSLKESLNIDVQNLEQAKREQLEEAKNSLDKAIEELSQRKNNLENEVNEKKRLLETDLQQTKKDVEYYDRTKKELEQTIDNLREDFREEQKQSQLTLQNLVKSKIHFDFISGRDLSEQDEKKVAYSIYKLDDQFNKSQYRDFRNELVNILRQNGRAFETHFVDNLLISVFQNTLTVLAGVPGTGKTTLARILCQILSPKEKIREISVNRGWSSQKDFIGFVNPLTKKFHSSSTDFYSLLKQLDHESLDKSIYLNSPMSFVILDEANLSPLEHYWSSFYNLTDSNGMLEIKLGHEEIIKFPNNLRFLGTINYDHTTEELSPRVLDRINVIQLDKTVDVNLSVISNVDIDNIRLSFQRCVDFFELLDFNAVELNKIDDKIEKAYKEIKTEFKSLKIFISTRVEIAIKRYINLATKYMSDVNKPLDYCVAQRLLPSINLQGSEYKTRLESLRDKLRENKCEISAKVLDDIISIGSEKGIYEDNFNYFLTLSNV